jgi:hypothetical protein
MGLFDCFFNGLELVVTSLGVQMSRNLIRSHSIIT